MHSWLSRVHGRRVAMSLRALISRHVEENIWVRRTWQAPNDSCELPATSSLGFLRTIHVAVCMVPQISHPLLRNSTTSRKAGDLIQGGRVEATVNRHPRLPYREVKLRPHEDFVEVGLHDVLPLVLCHSLLGFLDSSFTVRRQDSHQRGGSKLTAANVADA